MTMTSVRPFGLTRTRVLGGDSSVSPFDGLRYDPALQLNVNDNGTPVVDTPEAPSMATNQNTQADHQWWTDKD